MMVMRSKPTTGGRTFRGFFRWKLPVLGTEFIYLAYTREAASGPEKNFNPLRKPELPLQICISAGGSGRCKKADLV
jgi:hypothetical protein